MAAAIIGVVQFSLSRGRTLAQSDARDLEPELRRRAELRREEVQIELARRGDEEAESLRKILEDQRRRIAEANRAIDDPQLLLPGIADAEREQMRRDRQRSTQRLAALPAEIETEPARVRDNYLVRAFRLEPVGLVYLWPVTN